MTTRVLLLRHGETSAPTVFHGAESDIGLSDKGRRQAEVVAPLIAALRPDVDESAHTLFSRSEIGHGHAVETGRLLVLYAGIRRVRSRRPSCCHTS